MSKVIDILKSNRLYDESYNRNEIAGNKIDTFLDTYKYNPTKKHFYPKNITRDKNGNILLDEIPYIVSNIYVNGDNKPFWIILNNGSKILIKDVSNETIELELLIMYFLKELDMSCAKYDRVLLNGKTYISSNSFLRNSEEINFVLPVPGRNIEQNIEITRKYNAYIFYLKTVLIDRLYGNIDRHANFGIITGTHMHGNPAPPRITPLFDNGDKSLFREYEHDQLFPGINGDDSMDTVISYLLNYEFIEFFIKDKLKNMSLEKCASLLEKEKGIVVSNDVESAYKKLEHFFKDSENEVNDALKTNGRSFRIKLT